MNFLTPKMRKKLKEHREVEAMVQELPIDRNGKQLPLLRRLLLQRLLKKALLMQPQVPLLVPLLVLPTPPVHPKPLLTYPPNQPLRHQQQPPSPSL